MILLQSSKVNSHSTTHIELSGFTGMTLKKGTILNFINVNPFQFKYIIIMYTLKIMY